MLELLNAYNSTWFEKHGVKLFDFLFLVSVNIGTPWNNIYFSEELMNRNVEKGFVRKTEDFYELTNKGKMLFEPEEGLFKQFLDKFPTRVSDSQGKVRVLSPVGMDAKASQKLHRLWYKITKGDREVERHIMACLEAELNMRKNSNNLYYMRTMESWLNQATWEDYAYLLVKEENTFTPTANRSIKL